MPNIFFPSNFKINIKLVCLPYGKAQFILAIET